MHDVCAPTLYALHLYRAIFIPKEYTTLCYTLRVFVMNTVV